MRWEISDRTSLSFSASYLKDSVLSYYGTPLIYDAIIDQNGVQAVRRANTATDTLVNARIEPGTRRLNYNNTDNFSRGENGFYRVIFETRWVMNGRCVMRLTLRPRICIGATRKARCGTRRPH